MGRWIKRAVPWTSQPQYPVRIKAEWLAKGLTLIKYGKDLAPLSDELVATREGLAGRIYSATEHDTGFRPFDDNNSLFIDFTPLVLPSYGYMASCNASGTYGAVAYRHVDTANKPIIIGSNVAASWNTVLELNKRANLSFTLLGTGAFPRNVDGSYNGNPVVSIGTVNANANASIKLYDLANLGADAAIRMILGFVNYKLTDADVKALWENPNCIFEPQSRNIRVPSAGGTQYNQAAAGTLAFTAGALMSRTGKTVAGVLSFAGALAGIRTVLVAVAGTLSFASGAAVNTIGKGVAGTLSFAGDIVKTAQRAISGTLSFTGNATGIRTILQAIGGTLSFTGASLQGVGKQVSGTLSFAAGGVVRSVSTAVVGTLSFAGGVGKQVAKGVSGVLAFIGALLGTIVGAPAAPNMPPTTRWVIIGAESRFLVIGVEDRYVEVSA